MKNAEEKHSEIRIFLKTMWYEMQPRRDGEITYHYPLYRHFTQDKRHNTDNNVVQDTIYTTEYNDIHYRGTARGRLSKQYTSLLMQARLSRVVSEGSHFHLVDE